MVWWGGTDTGIGILAGREREGMLASEAGPKEGSQAHYAISIAQTPAFVLVSLRGEKGVGAQTGAGSKV